MTIKVSDLTKVYRVLKKEEGLGASIKNLIRPHYDESTAVNKISFEIEQGEIVGFIGSNGAGKTTTLKMLSGILYPTSGELQVLGFTPYERSKTYLKQISLVMGQKNQLWWDLPAIDSFSLLKEIYDIPEKQYEETLYELLELLDMKQFVRQQMRQLSLGQRMKAELIAALLHKPKVLFLDEPTIGLDVVMQKRVREFIKDYNKKYNATVILTSHYMDDVQEICERVIVINKGQLLFDGKVEELIKKHANYKLLIPVFNSQVKEADLKNLGQLDEFTYPKAVLRVPRNRVSWVASELFKKYEIDDLDISEPSLEDITRKIFSN